MLSGANKLFVYPALLFHHVLKFTSKKHSLIEWSFSGFFWEKPEKLFTYK